MKKHFVILTVVFISYSSNAQVLISLLFGDKLNSDKIEFGLDGGINFSDIQGVDAKYKSNFNLGFYFDFKMKNPAWMINTGVIVKSTMGAKNLPLYSLNDSNLNNSFVGGSVTRNLEYFNVPILMKYQFKNRIFIKAGPQLGLLFKAKDVFLNQIENKDDLQYTLDVKKQFHPLDAGFVIGAGYRLQSGNGMNLGIHYYQGLVDVYINDKTSSQLNKSIYLNIGIPIGVGKNKKVSN